MSDKTCFVIAPIGPSFRTVAGAKLMVILPRGRRRALLLSALRTRSLLSLTAVSGKPTTATLSLRPPPGVHFDLNLEGIHSDDRCRINLR
jgi:hypothetical protein